MISITQRLIGSAFIAALFVLPLGAFAADKPSGSFAEDAFTAVSKATVTGEAEDTRYVRVVVRNDAGKQVYKKDMRVTKEGEWKVKISKKLPRGAYDLELFAGKTSKKSALLDEATLAIGERGGESTAGAGTTLGASSVPLLVGGIAYGNTSIPVTYLKLVNTSRKESAIDGVTLVQNGTAPTSLVTTFTTSDDKGGSRATMPAVWNGNRAFVPLKATFAPGQMRIFTIKAGVSQIGMSSGKHLMLDVSSVETAAKVSGAFPIRGTTWTLAY